MEKKVIKAYPATIIIVTYNAMPWIDKCLQSVGSCPVVVVDNASTDQTLSHIQNNYANVTLLPQSHNLGFGQANNIGIRYALDGVAEHVLLLNQDAYLVDDVLDNLISFQKSNVEYGILSPIHITANKQKLDKNFSNFMLREKTGSFYSDYVLGNRKPAIYEVPFVNAAAWLISRKCLETVGGFDPLFFHYGEDDNYCQRVSYHGFKIGVIPNTYIIHDRADRIYEKPEVFSESYFNEIEKKYKVVYANINNENKIDIKTRKLKILVLKLQLNLKFRRANQYWRELNLIKSLKPKIERSRAVNSKIGQHYL
ncbi:glycosyltransferase family 2 protein [Paucihalobacter sp.]|uniref:glycosyltransferase family 2 protein n=1 Tax=Paucihalobacter sp. TaxID=2850405 RepID=UPI003D161ED0